MSGPIERTALATGLVSLAGFAAFAWLTHGFAAVTSETARRQAVAASPIAVPSLQGTDQDGRSRPLFADLGRFGPARVTIVDFVYTRCASVCRVLGDDDERLQASILSRHLENRVRLLTVSFDPAHDTSAVLHRYAVRMRADPAVWTLMRPLHAEQLPRLLAAFGVVVVKAPMEQFQHNAAFHVLDANGRLARIVDPDDVSGALDAALSLAPAS
jgi:protein SCO1/2